MKTAALPFVLLTLLFSSTSNAQPVACIWCGYNVSIQPAWGPVGYSNADYYYLPDIEFYYNVNERVFIFQENGEWKTKASLPAKHATFNLYRAHKVVFNEEKPYLNHEENKVKYAAYKGVHDQVAIRDSDDPKYDDVKNRVDKKATAGRD